VDSETLLRHFGLDHLEDVALVAPMLSPAAGTREERCPICNAIARSVGRDGRSLRFRCPECGLEFSGFETRDQHKKVTRDLEFLV